MPAFNLNAAVKSTANSAVNTAVSTVSAKVGASVGGKIPGGLGGSLSTNKLGAALLGGVVGGLLDGGKGAAIGGLLGASGVLGVLQNKLQGLIGDAEELTGLLDNPLKIIERGAADLAGLTGEDTALQLSQYRDQLDNSAYDEFVDNAWPDPYKGNDSSASRVPNPLRNHNGVNYKISLGILSAEEYNDPGVIRTAGGFKSYIIQSGGGNLEKRYQVADEVAGNVAGNHHNDGTTTHAEYYIDDLNIEGVIAPNPNTRVTLGTALTFNVTEPYSMGNFIQAVIGSAAESGESNYLQAPFCLRIDFVGWNLDGYSDANFVTEPIFIPIKLVNMEFNVSGQGSRYAVTAVPMAETGLDDNINKIKTSITAYGKQLHEILETNDASITAGINGQIQNLEEAGALAPYDRYIIAFPKDEAAIRNALKSKTIDEESFTTTAEKQAAEKGQHKNPDLNESNATPESLDNIVIKQSTNIFNIIKSFAENTDLMNEIGLSPVTINTNAPGNTPAVDAQAVTDDETGLVDTAAQAAQPSGAVREHQFKANEQITTIIEKLVLQTEYAMVKSTEETKNGMSKWFRIDTQVYLEESKLTEATMGRKPKVYVFSVVPYEVDEAVTAASSAKASNAAGLRAAAAKEYNYIYTGKNEDVLAFDINFNNAFQQTAFSDLGMNSGSRQDTNVGTTATVQQDMDAGATIADPKNTGSNNDPGGGTQLETKTALSPGSHSLDIRTRIAENFHDRITNLTADMITAEMSIMGDPFFIPQQTGNYTSMSKDKPSVGSDGTMIYTRGQVFCVVNFKTPFDYQVKGATMEMPQTVQNFSGLYNIWAVVNNFSKGQFTQTLKMVRRVGQDDPATEGSKSNVEVSNESSIKKGTVVSDGTVGAQNQGIDCIPAPANDDITKLLPAIPSDEADKLSAGFKDLEAAAMGAVTNAIPSEIAGVDFGLVKALDLSKIIPKAIGDVAFGAIAGKIGGAGGLAIASLASDAIGGIGVAASGGYTPTGLQASLATDQLNTNAVTASLAVNSIASTSIASVSGAATDKAKSLLKGVG